MAEHILRREIVLELPRKEIFAFFSDAQNLERLTPPELDFRILTPMPIEMRRGALIDYQLGLFGFPLNWRTEISVWDPPNEFVDIQLSGPYSQWVHRHTFTEISADKTQISDEVRYRLPLEPLGDLAHLFVRWQLERIFDYRSKAVTKLLGR